MHYPVCIPSHHPRNDRFALRECRWGPIPCPYVAVPVPVSRENGAAAATPPALTDSVAARITESMASSRADGTLRAYASAWRRFADWCSRSGHIALPAHPATVAAYLVDAADTVTPDDKPAYAPATFSKWVAAIAYVHRRSGHTSPTDHETVRATLSGIRPHHRVFRRSTP